MHTPKNISDKLKGQHWDEHTWDSIAFIFQTKLGNIPVIGISQGQYFSIIKLLDKTYKHLEKLLSSKFLGADIS